MKLFLSVKIELYFEYDFKYIIFKISTSPAPTSPNHRLTNAFFFFFFFAPCSS